MANMIGAIDALTTIALQAVKEVIEINTKIPIKASSTVQRVPKVSMKPEIGGQRSANSGKDRRAEEQKVGKSENLELSTCNLQLSTGRMHQL